MVNVKRLVSKRKFEKARVWFIEAAICRIRASIILKESSKNELYDFHGTLEALQHCYELCVKVLFLITGFPEPKNHEPAKSIEKVIRRFYHIFPDWESKEEVSKFFDWIKINDEAMAKLHETTIYGVNSTPASKLFNLKKVFEIFEKVNFLYSFLKGPFLYIGIQLNLLNDDEQKMFRELWNMKKQMNADPEYERQIRQSINDFLETNERTGRVGVDKEP